MTHHILRTFLKQIFLISKWIYNLCRSSAFWQLFDFSVVCTVQALYVASVPIIDRGSAPGLNVPGGCLCLCWSWVVMGALTYFAAEAHINFLKWNIYHISRPALSSQYSAWLPATVGGEGPGCIHHSVFTTALLLCTLGDLLTREKFPSNRGVSKTSLHSYNQPNLVDIMLI